MPSGAAERRLIVDGAGGLRVAHHRALDLVRDVERKIAERHGFVY